MSRIKTKLGNQLKKYGAVDFTACYNCGNCTAVCALSTEENSFPREMVRYGVLGMEDELKSSLKPWLCYYCGECTTHCPQTANPGELMMSLRRWLTSKYDWTGISGLLYKSTLLSFIAFLMIAAGIISYAWKEDFNPVKLMHWGHLFEMIAIGSVFLLILLPNLIRMWWLVILKPGIKTSLKSYFSALKDLLIHMFTQKRSLGCDDNQVRWFEHMILVFGYLALLFTTVFLDWFATENLFIILLGYLESFIIFTITIIFVLERVKKSKEVSKFSQASDWFFIIWLLLMGLSAFIVRLFIDTGWLERYFWVYLIHLIILAQWAMIIVPFGKWTHFLYRSFAMYFEKIIEKNK